MTVLFLVLPLALLLSAVAVWAFLWASRCGQFDDLKTPAVRILHDDDVLAPRDTEVAVPKRGANPRR